MMPTGCDISINQHTTSSDPHPHIVYIIQVRTKAGKEYQVSKRFSEFYKLHEALGDPYAFPSKDAFATSVLPNAWVDDKRLAERKNALEAYLTNITKDEMFSGNTLVVAFLSGVEPTNLLEMSSFGTLTQTMSQKESNVVGNPVAAAYYPSWSADSRPPNKIDFSKFDILFYAFVVPNSSSTISWDSGSQETLRSLVSSARKSGKGTKIVLSIGGWAGSYWFSQSMSTSDKRQTLANSLLGAVKTFGLDGIDIDWEYPNSPGSGNPYSRNDAANFLAFLKVLRTGLGWSKIISAAVTHQPWVGADGRPLRNVAEYSAQMTYVNIMNYDVSGGASPPGPNAPLGNACHTGRNAGSNAQAALAMWTAAGFPASKLLLGLALYGYAIRSSSTRMSNGLISDGITEHEDGILTREGNTIPKTDPMNPDEVAPAGDLSRMWGQQVSFNQLLAVQALKKQQDGSYVAAMGYKRGWDNCSSTPFLFNPARNTFVSYDDPQSLALKAKFAKQKGLGGCFTWSLDQDDGLALQNVIRNSLGK